MTKFRHQLIMSHIGLVLLVLILVFLLVSHLVKSHLINEKHQQLTVQSKRLASVLALEILSRGGDISEIPATHFEIIARKTTGMSDREMTIISPDNEILFHSGASKIAPDIEKILSEPPYSDLLNENTGGILQSFEDESLIGVLAPIKMHTESPTVGSVLTHKDTASTTEAVADVQKIVVQTGLMAVVAALGVSIIMARSVSHSAEHLSSVIRGLGKGQMDRRADESNVAEFNNLAQGINDMAEQLSDLLRRRAIFTAQISHEIKTPITSIRGYTQAMLDDLIPKDEYDHYLQFINDETRKVEKMLDELLQLEKLRAGEFSIQFAWKKAKTIVESAAHKLSMQIEKDNLHLQIIVRDNPEVWCDEQKIEQVIQNLIDNAVRHSPHAGTIEIGCAVINDNSHDPIVEFWVSDEGPGIEQNDFTTIFEPFYTSSSKKENNNDGLGLSISRQIILKHGGKLWGYNKSDGGAIFNFTLPMVKE